ncbi:ATP-binding protein [Actinosynnema sp. NPDC053489]|uniref:ATP-binding protein n=1 Tax=Actinosynnema sp. NPDC053489 TaxID=3363916 RepID=UPI0037CA6271
MRRILTDAGVTVVKIDERSFPGERWLIAFVPEEFLAFAQSLAGDIEQQLNTSLADESYSFAVTFRPQKTDVEVPDKATEGGRLAQPNVTQLIQLLEARSRTSDALPSLSYVEDPRASLAAVAASRHHLIYGRRGVGKTALLLEAKRIAERDGHVAVWMNAHTLRHLDAASAFTVIADSILDALQKQSGTSQSPTIKRLEQEHEEIRALYKERSIDNRAVAVRLPAINQALRGLLRQGIARLYLFLDDFYLMPSAEQPQLLDHIAGMLRDCDAWIKVASIERLTRPFEPSTKVGLEIPHDASKIDLDVTLEDPAAAQSFLEAVLSNYVTAAGIRQPSSIAKPEALGRLVIASGGVPRDYLNLFASSIVFARQSRPQAREIGREDVAKASNESSRSKKRDLEQDVSSETSSTLLSALEKLSSQVKAQGYAYFRVDMAEQDRPGYEILAQLVDLRFTHLIQAGLSDQHKAGKKYEAYMLDLSEYADVRLKRSLEVLDLETGKWVRRLTGKAGTKQKLAGTQLRDYLRRSPLVHLDSIDTPR